ncbi:histidinol dehydrogenase [Sporosarcina ureilytica]|uniref:Histidinol dehydrogenase n=2 Tax=Sporosarcina ureilytica TaxID=298596 RepID=A0A1D8JK99_9BACL|nr:histidinol dehydrogenase [Sporosarcina ureilytica]
MTGKEYQAELRNNRIRNEDTETINRSVRDIIQQVRERGDEALVAYTAKFDHVQLTNLTVSIEEIEEAREIVGESFIQAIQSAIKNIKGFHEEQREKTWLTNPSDGVMLGQKVTPLESVGIYVPGGKAAYPSTVLMNTIPAKIAGVKQIAITTPVQEDGKVNPYVLTAAAEVGVETIYKVGGAQAVAALAYGTETVGKVVKIVGPGNAYVACAKKWVFGDVAIDMIAGPSEICIVADESANPKYAAADLLSQAEHDELASAICITTSDLFAEALQLEIQQQMESAERKAIIEQSIANQGRIVVTESLAEAYELVNELAPEHLQLMVENPMEKLSNIKNAGAIFLGNHSPEALGDYLAGPNHTLPTSGTSTFSSPLGVYDFVKKTSIIHYSAAALNEVADDIITIANAEGLYAHANSIAIRKEN